MAACVAIKGDGPRMTSTNDGVSLAQQNASSSPSSLRKKVGLGVGVCRKCGNEGGHVTKENDDNKRAFKKGPWTAEEDALLIEYVKNHGERHWNCVQKTGLLRCGKSCRLRWTNHLRPDLKKGTFSLEEERIVLDLHSKLGNKWSKIAAELPGRTDNEVKNFWNTKIKRRMKANLLAINSDGKSPKKTHTFCQQQLVKAMQKKNGGIEQEISSTPESVCAPHTFFAPKYIPMSPNLTMISSSRINDPILSLLNNPAYKFQLVTEDKAANYDVANVLMPFSPMPRFDLSTNLSNVTSHGFLSHSQPHSISLDTASSSNTTFIRNPPADLTSCPCNKIELPSTQMHYHHLPMTSTSGKLPARYELDDVWFSSSFVKPVEVEKSSVTQEGKSELLETINNRGETVTALVGQSISDTRELEDHGHVLSHNEMMKPRKEEIEELVSMDDDDLTSLLYDFSTHGTPSPLNISSGVVSKFINHKEASDLSFATIPTPSTISTPEFS